MRGSDSDSDSGQRRHWDSCWDRHRDRDSSRSSSSRGVEVDGRTKPLIAPAHVLTIRVLLLLLLLLLLREFNLALLLFLLKFLSRSRQVV